jgi:endoglucanase Acf2
MLLFTLQLTLKYLYCPKGGVSFNSRINDLQNSLTMQVDELKQWQDRADSEAEMRWQAEMKINELERIIQVAQKDNQRLEIEVQEWKLVAEQCRTRTMKYDQAMRKILIYLEEVKPELDR